MAVAVAAIVALVVIAVVAREIVSGDDGPGEQTTKKAMWGPLTFQGRSLFPTYRDLGVGIFQSAVRWDWVAPTRPARPTDPRDRAYRWPSYLGEAVSEAKRNGMQVMVMVIGAPRWSNGGRSWQWPPRRPSEFGDFATAIARKYPSVHLWMIWGEPNRKPNFGPLIPVTDHTGPLSAAQQVAPRTYAQLLDSAYQALKAVTPENLVIGGNTYTSAGIDDVNPYQWIEYMRLPDGRRPRMDLWGHNAFGFRKPDLSDPPSKKGAVAFGDLDDLAEELDRARFPNAPLKLYIAEWGVPIGFKDKDLRYKLEPEEGEEWIEAGFGIAREWDRIYTLGWVHPIDTDRASQGLLDRKGKRKPGYEAYKEAASSIWWVE
jgi:hypothetical protein